MSKREDNTNLNPNPKKKLNKIISLFEENGPLRNSVTQIGLLDKIDNGTLTSEQIKKLMTTAVTQVNLLEDKEGNNSEFDPKNPETFDVFEDDELAIDEDPEEEFPEVDEDPEEESEK